MALLVSPACWRPPVDPGERDVWSRFRVGVAAVALGALVPGVLDLAGTAADVRAGTFRVCCLLALAAWYGAMIRWNQDRTHTSDGGDWFSGISSVLVLTALMMACPAGARAGHAWPVQLHLFTAAAVFVLLGVAATVMSISGFGRDRRLRWMTGGFAVLVVLQTGVLGPLLVEHLIWLLVGGVFVACVRMRPMLDPPWPVNAQATVVGSLVVVACGLAALAVDAVVGADPLVTLYAVAGCTGSGIRVVRLVGDLAQLSQRRTEALTDELTGIANRRALLSTTDVCLAENLDPPPSLIMLGLDRFKAYNDRHGHGAGDLLLRRTATALAAAAPAGSTVARLGSDEFAVLLLGPHGADAVRVAGGLAGVVEAIADADGRAHQVGVSIGVASAEGLRTSGELLHRADAAMDQAKSSGSVLRLYDSELDAAAQERLILTEDLREALRRPARRPSRGAAREQVVAWFQPQIDVATGQVAGAEALVRWQHTTRGLLTPDRFVDLAEENGMMAGLTEAVLRQAVDQSRRWEAIGHPIRLSVNLSAAGLGEPWLLPLVEDVLTEGIDPESLVLEVTEYSLMTDPDDALAAMQRITGLGVGISIDDYGTGYSSLRYMNDLPATELKIDRSFVRRMLTAPRTAAIVAATVELGHRLGMRLVAEGVEDEATFSALRDLGCDLSQGYLHSRPIPADDFVQWLTGHRNHVPASTSHISTREVRPG
jgi:diguanylate cyclase (GGDEF)-like protein